jgi:hypothetical protein
MISDPVITTQTIQYTLEAAKDELQVADVYYGYTGLIPTFPAITVEEGRWRKQIKGTHKYEVMLATVITIFYGKVQDAGANTLGAGIIATQVVKKLEEDRTLGDQIINSFVTQRDPVNVRGTEGGNLIMFRAIRLLWEALSEEVF